MYVEKINFIDRVKHDKAKNKIINKLNNMGLTTDDIIWVQTVIREDNINYEITLKDKTFFRVFDNGLELH